MGVNNEGGEFEPEKLPKKTRKKPVPAPIVSEGARRTEAGKKGRVAGANLRRGNIVEAGTAINQANELTTGQTTKHIVQDRFKKGFLEDDSGEHKDES